MVVSKCDVGLRSRLPLSFVLGLRESVPVAISFMLSFFAIGALSRSSALSLVQSVVMTAVVFAGPAQYTMLSLFNSAPFLADGVFQKLSPAFIQFVSLCGYAIIGSQMSETVFAPFFSSSSEPITDVLLRVGVTFLALFLMLRLRRQVLSLSLSYLLFVALYFFFITGSTYHG